MLPLGAPVDLPPCIRHRPFDMLGPRHGVPLRVLAPHLGAFMKAQRMGLILLFSSTPAPPGDVANDGLTALMDVDVLDRHLLLALAAVLVEGFHLRRVGAG